MTILQMTEAEIEELHSDIDYIQNRVFSGDTVGSMGFVARMTTVAEKNQIVFHELKIKFALRLKQRHQDGLVTDDQIASVPDALREYFTLGD